MTAEPLAFRPPEEPSPLVGAALRLIRAEAERRRPAAARERPLSAIVADVDQSLVALAAALIAEGHQI